MPPKRSFASATGAQPYSALTVNPFKRQSRNEGINKSSQEDKTSEIRTETGQSDSELDTDQGCIYDEINSQIQHSIESNEGHVQGPLDPVFGQRRAFPITIDMSSVNVSPDSGIPDNVESYLAMVRLQAQRLDEELIAKQKETSSVQEIETVTTEIYINNLDESPIQNAEKEEDDKWREEFIEFFEQERADFTDLLEEARQNPTTIDLPDTIYNWKQFIFKTEPTPEILSVILDRQLHLKLIIYFTKWLSTNINGSGNSNLLQWIFQLFVAYPDVMIGSEISLLRGMAKKANKLLSKMKLGRTLDSSTEASNNTDTTNEILRQIVAIVAVKYGQRDLLNNN